MWRGIIVSWSGEGCEVRGVGARVDGCLWDDFATFDGALSFTEGVMGLVRSLPGWSEWDSHLWVSGVGESYRALEVWIVDAQTGKASMLVKGRKGWQRVLVDGQTEVGGVTVEWNMGALLSEAEGGK